MKFSWKWAGGALTLMLAAGALGGQVYADRPLTVVSWGGAYQDAQKKVYFEPFKKESGKDLIDESWDGGIGVIRSKVEGGTDSGWDVVQVESEELVIGCDEGLFEPIDWDKIGGKDAYIAPAVHECGVGAILYDNVLSYDKDKLKEEPRGWSDFFDTTKFPGKRALRQGPKVNLELALMADGVAPGDVYKTLSTPEGVDRAFKKLDSIKKELIWWKSGAQPPQLLASGEVVMTSAYNGRIDAANRTDKRNFGIQWNEALFTLDSWVVLKTSPNKDVAFEFLDFIGKPENQAKLPEAIAYGVTAKGATKLIDPKRLPDLPTAPENIENALQISDSFWIENIDRLNERFNTWAAS
ncbi:putative spermidine/putrescine transport system substrate-binding protein [Rhodoligotrophos appendicifer]|uniref:ABC transporter substrate-binding protein n=1 Tax=Rhodoligotrophos appendicifer TaxID=987056 RepID=UPI001479270E|nr:ABC transporter substrate-binding protein [Rhodoligotrophos appendicifer]